jgi:ABC-2 type transport system ATP-binding protein
LTFIAVSKDRFSILKNSTPLEVKNLTKTYKGVKALNQLSFSIEKGEVFGLLGPNGAGKTTLVSLITTLEEASEGTVHVFGFDVQQESAKAKSLIGVVPQEIVHPAFFTIDEILQFHSGYYGIAKNKDRINFLLDRLKLADHRDKMVKQLSGGMKRRLMIAKALVHTPKLLLLDEPTAGVDISLREILWDFVLELKQQGVTILLTTHYLQEAENLCQRILVINQGQFVCLKNTKDVIQELSQREIYLKLNCDKKISNTYLKHQNESEREITYLVPARVQVGDVLQQSGIAMHEIIDISIKEGGLDEALKKLLKSSSRI